MRFVRSGIGDAMSNISAIADWELAHRVNGEKIDGLAAAMARRPARPCCATPAASATTPSSRCWPRPWSSPASPCRSAGDSRPVLRRLPRDQPRLRPALPQARRQPRRAVRPRRRLRDVPARRARGVGLHGRGAAPARAAGAAGGDRLHRRTSSSGSWSTPRRPAPAATRSWNTSTSRPTRSRTPTPTMSRPSVAELRPVVHPAGVKDRRSGEHWAGRLYMREVSLRVDRYLVNTRVTPNQLTYLMTVAGVLAAPALLVPGIAGRRARRRDGPAVPAARLRRRRDRPLEEADLAHRRVPGPRRRTTCPTRPCWSASGCAPPTCGAAGRIDWLWAFLGTLAALGAILIKAETDLVGVARHQSGLPAGQGGGGRAALLRAGAGPQGRRRAQVPPAGPRHRGVACSSWSLAVARPGRRRPVLHPPRHRRTGRHRPAADPAAPGVHPRLEQAASERGPEGRRGHHHHGQPPRGTARPPRLGRQAGRRPGRGRRGRQRLPGPGRSPRAYAPSSCPRTSASPAAATSASRPFGPAGGDVDVLLFLDDDGLLARHGHRRAVPRGLRRRPRARHHQLPHRRPRHRRHPAPPRARGCAPRTRCAPRASPLSSAAPTPSVPRSSPQVGSLPEEFFYAHEETDLAWRALDAGWMIDYRADMVLLPPDDRALAARGLPPDGRPQPGLAGPPQPSRAAGPRLSRSLAAPHARSAAPPGPALRAWFGGFREGWTAPCGPRRPMRWRTVWRLTRLGRPPVI